MAFGYMPFKLFSKKIKTISRLTGKLLPFSEKTIDLTLDILNLDLY